MIVNAHIARSNGLLHDLSSPPPSFFPLLLSLLSVFFFCTYERETSSSRRRETTNERAKRAQDKKLVNLLLSFLLACCSGDDSIVFTWNRVLAPAYAFVLCARSYKKINHFEAILLLFFCCCSFFFFVVLWCSRSRAVRLQFSHINSPRKWITLNIINYTILSSSLLSLSLFRPYFTSSHAVPESG